MTLIGYIDTSSTDHITQSSQTSTNAHNNLLHISVVLQAACRVDRMITCLLCTQVNINQSIDKFNG